MHGFFPTFHALITWFELSRVKLCTNDLKGKKITSSQREVRVIEGSSNRR